MDDTQMGPQQQNGPTQQPNPPAPAPAPQPDPTAQAPQGGVNPNVPPPPPPPGSFFHNLSHSLIGAVLGHSLDAAVGNGGNTTTGYTTDDTGKQTPVVRPMTTSEKLKSIAARALQGLAAGASAPEQKTGLASALAGMGAGAKAAKESNLQEDARKRQLSTDEFEREQKATLQKADIMKSNMLTLSMGYANLKAGNDLTPEYARNQSTFDAAQENADFSGHTRIMTEGEAMAAQKNDKNFGATHRILPLGKVPTLDQDGKQLLNPDGSLQTHMQVGVFDASKDGKWAITPEEEKDIQEYGPMANIRGSDDIHTGDLYDMHDVTHLMNEVNTVKKNILQGWEHSTIGVVKGPDGKDQYVRINAADPTRTQPIRGAMPLSAETEEAGVEEKNAAAQKDIAEGKKDIAEGNLANANAASVANAANLTNALNSDPTLVNAAHQAIDNLVLDNGQSNDTGKEFLRTVAKIDPSLVAPFLAAANSDIDIKTLLRRTNAKPGSGLTPQFVANGLEQINHHWTEQTFEAKKKELNDISAGKGAAANIGQFNQYIAHTAQAAQVIRQFQTTNSPYLNTAINKLRQMAVGDPSITALIAAIEAPKSEYGYFLRGGNAASKEDEEKLDELYTKDSTPNQILAAYGQMMPQALSRVDAVNQGFYRNWGVNIPNLISPEAREAAAQLGYGDDVAKYNTGGTTSNMHQPGQVGSSPQAGQTPQLPSGVPQGATHIAKDANQNVVGYVLNGKYIPIQTQQPPAAPPTGGNQ